MTVNVDAKRMERKRARRRQEKKKKKEETRGRRRGGGETERGGLAFAPARAASAPRVSV